MLKAYSGLKDCDDSTTAYISAMNVTGSNLTGACKLVFKIARNENNDNLFMDSDVPELDELLFATLGALHNLSYYYEPSDTDGASYQINAGSIAERMKDICGTLCSILGSDHNPARSEVARVLGNMTRNTATRQTFCEQNGMKILKQCLTSKNDELMVTSCGVLVNMLGDWSSRVPFHEIDGPTILRRLLHRGVNNRDWIMAGIACQAIWNYLIDTSDIMKSLGQVEIDLICGALAEGLGEQSTCDQYQ
uniref:Armadillo repeat-containing protein 8 n=1 Tax=Anopheles merus TaxID=30066 RepID=A0A182V7F9_ANOME